ncbi:MAG TPA: DUF2306 domain-containing protein [Caulobacteraceae bacterium]|nr:DUF2306 domain-containing protein [Caulobacteraceae bacterium]
MKPSLAHLSIRPGGRVVIVVAIAALLALYLLLGGARLAPPALAPWRPHTPDLTLLSRSGVAIQLHLAAMLACLALGAILLAGPKGRRLHRALGWTFAVVMTTGVIASLFVRTLIPGSFSPIHILSVLTLVGLPLAVMAARRHNVAEHRKRMTSLFYFGLVGAGLFTLVPGRLLWRMFFG